MSKYPLTRLIFGREASIALAGPHIFVLDSRTGNIRCSTQNISDQSQPHSGGPIQFIATDVDFVHIATIAGDKKLVVWNLSDLQVLSSREIPKRATGLTFTRDGQTIIVSDKFGDVFYYPLHPPPVEETVPPPAPPEPEPSTKRSSLVAHDNKHGELILGHTSIITTFLLTPDEQYIITADRDEHIRVSWYPKGYHIERYCLGSTKFLSALCIPQSDHSVLISGGGDPSLRVWDWMSGKLLGEVPIFEHVRPFLKVKPERKVKGGESGVGRKGRKKRGAKEGEAEKPAEPKAEGGGAGEGEGEDEEKRQNPQTEEAAERAEQQSSEPEDVLVVSKIASFNVEEEKMVLFSAVGASALFYFAYPLSDAPPRYVDFGKPVLDFALGTEGNSIWVSVDGQWHEPAAVNITEDGDVEMSNGPEGEVAVVRHIRWRDGQFHESATKDAPPLFTALNSSCLIEASHKDLAALELYSDLAFLPKSKREEEGEEEGSDPGGEDKQKDKRLGVRALGRQKARMALLRKQNEELEEGQGASSSTGAKGGIKKMVCLRRGFCVNMKGKFMVKV
ncbi:hypothetical protein BOTBODRAFT_400049 [Botryobasidium botryosum FD-172 SS1]|uniref:Uncharacterized protein n=1 Tax=Botryobasidium botryosum (strain FD-172 SS1) TaxID=930990 RepID=A0A067MB54_BOTB1|nr:hypothetical protein BOTBODRAFT_400049 [Botryobasidium botryosum FD-172 SS1]